MILAQSELFFWYGRYVMSALDVKEGVESTLLADSAVLLKCMPQDRLKYVM